MATPYMRECREIQHNASNGRIRFEKSDANARQVSTTDQDFLQSWSGSRLREVDDHPVGVGHGLSERGDWHGCANLDIKIVIVATDSNVANGRNLLARLNRNNRAAR